MYVYSHVNFIKIIIRTKSRLPSLYLPTQSSLKFKSYFMKKYPFPSFAQDQGYISKNKLLLLLIINPRVHQELMTLFLLGQEHKYLMLPYDELLHSNCINLQLFIYSSYSLLSYKFRVHYQPIIGCRTLLVILYSYNLYKVQSLLVTLIISFYSNYLARYCP